MLFDFDKISALLRSDNFKMRFDAMHAVTGPYARRVFCDLLGLDDQRLAAGTTEGAVLLYAI